MKTAINTILVVIVMIALVIMFKLIEMGADHMDKGSAIIGEEIHQRKMAIMENEIKWCHDRGGTATIEIKKYKVSCSIPPRN